MAKIISGHHAIKEALNQVPPGSVLYLSLGEGRNDQLETLARSQKGVEIKRVSKAELDRLAGHTNHRGALLALPQVRTNFKKTIGVKEFANSLQAEDQALVLILDGITDVHNLGAILRSADQFAVDLVVIPQRRSGQIDATVDRISSGAAQYVQIATAVNLVREMEILKERGFWIYGADMDGSPLPKTHFARKSAIVMGSEGSGLSQLVKKRCDHIISIPTQGHIDSLNVSVATGILLYEVRRGQK